MTHEHHPGDVNIRLRLRARDCALIDQAAGLTGTSRSQFILDSALHAAKAAISDESTFLVDRTAFQKTLDWLDSPIDTATLDGIARLKQAMPPWSFD